MGSCGGGGGVFPKVRGGVPKEITDDVIVGGIRERRVGGAYGGVEVTAFAVGLGENCRAGVALIWICESKYRKLVTCYETKSSLQNVRTCICVGFACC